MKKIKILGANCLAVENIDEIKEYVTSLVEKGKGGYSVAINAEKIMMYKNNSEMRDIIDRSILPTPDGAGAVLGLRLLHGKRSLKLDLPKTVLELADENHYRVFILGASEDSNKEGTEKLRSIYPGIDIVGRLNGYFKDESEVAKILNESKPQIVLVALGSPKQEMFADRMSKKVKGVLFFGCGGALDILAGKVKRAPGFFINNNLEWFYRLVKQPSRIKRQWVLPVFVLRLIIRRLFVNKSK